MRTEVVKKIVAASMCALFMLSSCACNIADQIKSNVHERIVIQSQISVQELTRLIVSSINDDIGGRNLVGGDAALIEIDSLDVICRHHAVPGTLRNSVLEIFGSRNGIVKRHAGGKVGFIT